MENVQKFDDDDDDNDDDVIHDFLHLRGEMKVFKAAVAAVRRCLNL
jgi:hypothetical protein